MIGGYVLAGGRSSRMGTDKALLGHPGLRNGGTMLTHAAGTIEEVCGSCVIVGDPAKYGSLGYRVIEDRFAGSGPLAGIHAALSDSPFEWNLIVACDMPGLSVAGLQLLRASAEADAVIPCADGREQPLCALYRRTALATIEQALERRDLKIMTALLNLKTSTIHFPDRRMFHNVNTPEDMTHG